jgi:hypothetical protein
MKQQAAFCSRVGNRWIFAIEFEGIGDPPKVWNEWWGSLWLWANGQIVGRPFEIEMVMTGFDSLVDSAQKSENPAAANLASKPASEALDLVMWARYGVDDTPKGFEGDPILLCQHEILPLATGPFFDGWEAILLAENSQERFIFRQVGGRINEALWPGGTFKSLVFQALDEFKKLATASLMPSSSPYRH